MMGSTTPGPPARGSADFSDGWIPSANGPPAHLHARAADRKRIAGLIRDHLARQRISREQFAFATKLGKSTVDKLLVGLFSDRTLAVVEAETGLSLRAPDGGARGPAAGEGPKAALDSPSVAVLPFTNLSGDPEQDHVADGIAEDLTTDLSRLRWLSVAARGSSFACKGRAADVRQVGRELGVRHVLGGSVRIAAGRVRVSCPLADARTGRHVWAERYDRELGDVLALQDEIAGNVAAAVEPHLRGEGDARAPAAPSRGAGDQVLLVSARPSSGIRFGALRC